MKVVALTVEHQNSADQETAAQRLIFSGSEPSGWNAAAAAAEKNAINSSGKEQFKAQLRAGGTYSSALPSISTSEAAAACLSSHPSVHRRQSLQAYTVWVTV